MDGKVEMFLDRLEDFTPSVALRVLRRMIPREVKVRKKNLNLLGDSDTDRFIKYVVSIGDRIYQIVAWEEYVGKVRVIAKYSRLCGIGGWSKECQISINDFDANMALQIFKDLKIRPYYHKLILRNLSCIQNGILDDGMVKYVFNEPDSFGIYQIVGIKEGNSHISVVVKYSQI